MEDIFTVQDEIAASVADALSVTLEGGQTPKTKGTSPEVYTAFLKGRYFVNRGSKEDLQNATVYFERALQSDPNYAAAWFGLSSVHSRQADFGYIPVDEGYRKARSEVEKALKLDPNMAGAHAVMGWIKKNYDWDWAGADAAFRLALVLAPSNVTVIGNAAALNAELGRFDEALILSRRVIELNPLGASGHHNLGIQAYYAGRWDEAQAAFKKSLELYPLPGVHKELGLIYLAQSKSEEALDEMQKESEPVWREFGFALAYHAVGKKKEADAALTDFTEKYQNDAAFQIAQIHAYRGETNKAFE
jgi:tetratricopeptide (TPR) repeat protein